MVILYFFIVSNFGSATPFCPIMTRITLLNTIFSPVNSDEVKQCLQKLNPRKAIGQDKISPALIKMAAAPLSTPLSTAINK